jgi:hypothetical protein
MMAGGVARAGLSLSLPPQPSSEAFYGGRGGAVIGVQTQRLGGCVVTTQPEEAGATSTQHTLHLRVSSVSWAGACVMSVGRCDRYVS